MQILVTTVPFGKANSFPIDLLKEKNIDFTINPLNKKLTESELIQLVRSKNYDAIIAGTEPITAKVINASKGLKLISRVGVGLDGVDLLAAKEKGILVTYTPDAPGPAVAELTVCLMLSLLRSVQLANIGMHRGSWNRYYGRRISEVTIGMIGVGRIGTRVLNRLRGFGTPKILLNDLDPSSEIERKYKVEWASKKKILEECDVVTLHVPLTRKTKNMIQKDDLLAMKSDAVIINTSRGGIINENDLREVLMSGHLLGAAIDVFEEEPYAGSLKDIENCILTSHMGSMSEDCRTRMEIQATNEVVRFFDGKELESLVPKEEYDIQDDKRADF